MIFAGVDWAEDGHNVHVGDEQGRRLAGGRLADGVEGIARFHDLVASHAECPQDVVIGIETDRGLFVAALVSAGYQVFAVNPMSVSRCRGMFRRPNPPLSARPPATGGTATSDTPSRTWADFTAAGVGGARHQDALAIMLGAAVAVRTCSWW